MPEPNSPDTISIRSASPPDFDRKNSFSPVPTKQKEYTTRAAFTSTFTAGVNNIMHFIYENYKSSYFKISLIDGSNIFYLDKMANDWVRSEDKIRLLRAIPPDHTIILIMKHDTYSIAQTSLPIHRLLLDVSRSNVCIVTVDIPFCSSYMKANCIRKLQDAKPTQCSLSRSVRASIDRPQSHRAVHRDRDRLPRHRDRYDPIRSASRLQVTNFDHIYCEYDDVVLSKLYYMMYESPTIVSLDRQVLKPISQIDIFDEFNPIIHVQLITATA